MIGQPVTTTDLPPGITYLKLEVSTERLDEWLQFIDAVETTKKHDLVGDRILTLARTAIELQGRRRGVQRERRKGQKNGK